MKSKSQIETTILEKERQSISVLGALSPLKRIYHYVFFASNSFIMIFLNTYPRLRRGI